MGVGLGRLAVGAPACGDAGRAREWRRACRSRVSRRFSASTTGPDPRTPTIPHNTITPTGNCFGTIDSWLATRGFTGHVVWTNELENRSLRWICIWLLCACELYCVIALAWGGRGGRRKGRPLGAQVEHLLPPDGPDMNPIEKALFEADGFSAQDRRANRRGPDEGARSLRRHLQSAERRNYFAGCGYDKT